MLPRAVLLLPPGTAGVRRVRFRHVVPPLPTPLAERAGRADEAPGRRSCQLPNTGRWEMALGMVFVTKLHYDRLDFTNTTELNFRTSPTRHNQFSAQLSPGCTTTRRMVHDTAGHLGRPELLRGSPEFLALLELLDQGHALDR